MKDNINVEVIKASKTSLFCNYIFKAIPLAFDESMSYYECLCGLLNYLKNTIIPTVNNNADAVAELQELFTKLQNFVNNYFDNLDVQEEINNKLDQMVEDGTFENILSNYSNITRIYNTHQDLINDTNALVNNMKVKTLGYYEINDGGGAEYYITDTLDRTRYQEKVNNLYAELIIKDNTINIKQLGAKGNGVDDDSGYFRNILGKVENIFVPKGDYLFINTVNLSKYNVNIKGINGRYSNASNVNKSTIISQNDYAFKCEWPNNCNFEGLNFSGYGLNSPVASIISNCNFIGNIGIYNGRGIYVENCNFRQIEKGIQKIVDSTIINNNFSSCSTYCIDMNDSNDNRIENNRFEWSNIALYMINSLFNIIIGNIFDRQTLYAIQADTSPNNILESNNFERNLECHIYGKLSNWSIVGNRFIRKNSLDDQTGEKLPNICFKTDSFGHINLIGNKFACNKVWEKTPIGINTNNLVGNSLNDYSLDGFKKKIGILTVPANSEAKFSANIASNVNYLGLGGYSMDIEYVQLQKGNDVYTSGDSRIKRIRYNKNGDINITFNNETNNEITLDVYVKFIINSPYNAADNSILET